MKYPRPSTAGADHGASAAEAVMARKPDKALLPLPPPPPLITVSKDTKATVPAGPRGMSSPYCLTQGPW